MSLITSFVREQRHIFGICPHCHTLFRLIDVKISYTTPYKLDWLDKLDTKREKREQSIEDLKEREKQLREEAVRRARKKELPKLLKHIVPFFARNKLNPQDIKPLFHPIDFVAFDGLNDESVKQVLLMDHKTSDEGRSLIQNSISDAIKSDAIEWKTVRIGNAGEVSVE